MKEVTSSGPNFTQRLIDFLTRYRRAIGITLAVVAVAVVALVVVLSVQNARSEAALEAVADLEREFAEWRELDEDARTEAYGDILTGVGEIIDGYPRTYAAARARLIDASALAELGRWAEASARFTEVADLRPGTYLAPVALMDAAVAAENAGDAERALELHNRHVDEYEDESAEAPRALFSIGRILELQDDVAAAAETYRRLIEDYPASSWTNLARNRIIALTVEGRIGG